MSRDKDLLRRLREANPVPDAAVRGAAEGAQARETFERILQHDQEQKPSASPPASPNRRPWRWGVGAAAGAILAGLILVRSLPPPERAERPAPIALAKVARLAATRPLPVPGPGDFLYVHTRVTTAHRFVSKEGPWTVLVPREREIWIAPDGSGRIHEVPGKPIWPGPRDRRLWRASGRPNLGGRVEDRIAQAGDLLRPRIQRLNDDPEALRSALAPQDPAVRDSVERFVAAADLLGQPLVDRAVRAALYRVLAGVKGINLLGRVEDPLGRVGTAVAITSSASGVEERRILIFDPTSSEILADEVKVLEAVPWMDANPPVVTDGRIIIDIALVRSLRTRPSG